MAFVPKTKSERIKLYVLLAGCVLFVATGYFRFIHKKLSPAAVHAPLDISLGNLHVPRVEIEMPPNSQIRGLPMEKLLPASIRDIFSPFTSSPGEMRPSELQPSANGLSSLNLKGTIVGGKRPLAIINDQFVGLGDRIGKYRVVRIGKKEVLLDSGQHQIKLEMVKNE
jgi:hypothetical protein